MGGAVPLSALRSNQFRTAIQAARAAGATKIVLDLREDPGGLLDEAVGVASQFLSSGNVLIERDAAGHDTPVPVRADGAAVDTPLVVLIDGGTASAAEIVAGTRQDHRRALLIGTTTFCTGTVRSSAPAAAPIRGKVAIAGASSEVA